MTDLCPTQEVDDAPQLASENTENENIWGRLLPLKNKMFAIDLTAESYTFGRGEDCSYTFAPDMFDGDTHLLTLSKIHFKISSECYNQKTLAFLHDLSSNGTFVNGERVGRGNRCPLNNNDELSLSTKQFKCFIFSDSNSDQKDYPVEITDKYTISRTIGRGACGEVKLVFKKGSCKRMAMKVVQKKTFSLDSKLEHAFANRIRSEVDILMHLDHPCIIHINDVVDAVDAVYMVLELIEGGELFDRIINLGQLTEADAKFLFFQMTLAVKYLHHNGITHRDLKPENILLTNDDNRCLLKVTDFGLSKLVDGNTMLRTFCGTPTYLAPEVLKTTGSGTYTPAIDIWSLGVILYVCLVGYPPFTDQRQDHDLQTQIIQGIYDFPDAYWGSISDEAKDLVRCMLTVDPMERITLEAIIEHPWLTDPELVNSVYQLLNEAGLSNASTCSLSLINTNAYQTVSQEPISDASVQHTTAVPNPIPQNDLQLTVQGNQNLSARPVVQKRPCTDPVCPIPMKTIHQ